MLSYELVLSEYIRNDLIFIYNSCAYKKIIVFKNLYVAHSK